LQLIPGVGLNLEQVQDGREEFIKIKSISACLQQAGEGRKSINI